MSRRPQEIFTRRTFGIFIALILVTLIHGCRVAPPQRAKVWSVRTADAFAQLVKNGRGVATISNTNTTVKRSNSNSLVLGGLKVFATRRDPSGAAIVFAQFDSRVSPSVSATALETFAKDFIQKASSDLRVDPLELRVTPMSAALVNQRIVSFTREISGSPVRDSRWTLVFSDIGGAYHLTEINNRTWGYLKPEPRVASDRLTDVKIGQVISDSAAKITASGDSYKVDDRAKTAMLVPTTWYDVTSSAGEIFTLTFTGGNEPRLVEAFSHQVDAALEASVYKRNWTGERQFNPVSDARFSSNLGQQSLDTNGSIPAGVTSGQVTLVSKWARVHSENASSAAYNVAQDGGRIVVKSGGERDDANINVYLAIHRIRDYVMRFYKPGEVRYFDRQLAVTTNIQRTCNAFYVNTTLNFFHRGTNDKGKACANTALVNDVVYHEWGHGLDDYTGPGAENGGGMTEAAFSEGIGDAVGMFFIGESAMAPGFFTDDPSKPLRNLDNKKVYQQGVDDEIHLQGTIIGGAFWELRRRMINKYGEAGKNKAANLFFRHLLEVESFQDSYEIVQRVADEDNNPATRHADWCIVNHAFAVKGLAPIDSCTDDFATNNPVNPPPPNPNNGAAQVFFALGDAASGGNTSIYVSAGIAGAATARLCAGAEGCAQPVTMQIQKIESGVTFFLPASWSVSDSQTVNAEVLDGSGSELARRVVRFRKR